MSTRASLVLLPALLVGLAAPARAADGDTVHVHAFTFGGPNSGRFAFPPDSVRYHKVLLNFTARCPSGGCGEWDYLEYLYLDERRTSPDTTIRHELFRFITPYGNGLSLGSGFTWTMDVTDFAPLLHDSVDLVIVETRHQEDVDVTFDCILGTPPRDVLGIQRLWTGNPPFGQSPSIDSAFFTPRTLRVPANVRGARLHITQTGHGFGGDAENCAEFCDKIQYVKVADTVRYSRHVWRNTCGLNPVYPQGGTWVYNRSNWCPGAEVTAFDYELTPFMTPGDSMTVDVDMQPYTFTRTANGTAPNYVVASELLFYGPPHEQYAAEIERVLAPTTEQVFHRHNPVCGSPVVILRNTGAHELTAATIYYGVRGGGQAQFNWTGHLAFMEEEQVTLPPFDWGTWIGPNHFDVNVNLPDGHPNEDSLFSHAGSAFANVPTYYNDLEIHVRTNDSAAAQYMYTLRKSDGTLVLNRANMSDNTTYIDTVHLDDGCYTFQFINAWGFGLSWFATSPQLGSGSLGITSKGTPVATFNGDFGEEVYEQFRVAPLPTVAYDQDSLDFGTLPLGDSVARTVALWPTNTAGLTVYSPTIFLGRQRGYRVAAVTPPFDSTGTAVLAAGDTMRITVMFTAASGGAKNTQMSIRTNDQRVPTIAIPLLAAVQGSGVDEALLPGPHLTLRVTPNVMTDGARVAFDFDGPRAPTRITVSNALGRTVATLFEGIAGDGVQSVPFPAAVLPAGVYFITLRSGSTLLTAPARVVH